MANTYVPKLADPTNARLLNMIRNQASPAYYQRIPAADQGNVAKVLATLDQYKPQYNEFVDAMLNLVGPIIVRNKMFENPLAIFKRGDQMNYNGVVEEIFVDTVVGHRYDPDADASDVFKRNTPDVYSNFHYINRQDQYIVTFNDSMTKRAVRDDYMLYDMMQKYLASAYNADRVDDYLYTRNLLSEYERIDGFFKVKMPAIPAPSEGDDVRTAVAKYYAEQIQAWAMQLAFPSRDFNGQGVQTQSDSADLVFICSSWMKALLGVNVNAFAFNLGYVEVKIPIVVVDKFNMKGCEGILCDKDFFLLIDTEVSMEQMRNPKGRYWNYYLNHDGVYSISRFVNAIQFNTIEGVDVSLPGITIDSVILEIHTDKDGTVPKFATPGVPMELDWLVEGAVDPETKGFQVPQGVKFEIVDAEKPLRTDTYVTNEGWLHVSKYETAEWVKVKATSVYYDPDKPSTEQDYKFAEITIGIGEEFVETPVDPEVTG